MLSERNCGADVSIRFVTDVNDPVRVGFVDTYREVFAGPPYFEEYGSDDVINGVWIPHMGHCVLAATEDLTGRVVGLGCCHVVTADTEPKIRDYLLSRPSISKFFDPDRTIFMSELAVREEYRRRGLGNRIVLERFRWGLERGYESYCMRTAESGSNSRGLYERIGAVLAPFVQDVSVDGVASSSKSRVYMYGSIADALERNRNG
jgi:ribosomal protein S18 acetylase RimI-like enzyme